MCSLVLTHLCVSNLIIKCTIFNSVVGKGKKVTFDFVFPEQVVTYRKVKCKITKTIRVG